jgi:hypothetical protein
MSPPTRARILLAWVVVVLTVIAVWKFIDYQNQPPMPPAGPAASDQ